MALKNYYPEKPEIAYKKTMVEMPVVVVAFKQLKEEQNIPVEVIRAAYCMFRMESWNGKSGINNNYVGAQADSGRWPEKFDNDIIGVVTKNEGRTGKERLFVAFSSYTDSLVFLIDRVQKRGLHVGGTTHLVLKMHVSNAEDLCEAYYKEWVEGEANYEPTEQEMKDFKSMYGQSEKIFV